MEGAPRQSSTVNVADVYSIFHANTPNPSAAWLCDHIQNVGDEKKSYDVCIIQCKGKQTHALKAIRPPGLRQDSRIENNRD